ncbi:MAG TPA: diguanylate cyclase [Chloroflexaceae bacterium]|nr:diguanylate cyclase [Chloroflexaceae bacterium]
MSSQDSRPRQGDLLVVDDTSANLRLLAQVLQDAGHRVRAVMTGARALAAARQSPPDLVLLDLRLPDTDGVRLCAELKADPQTAQVPVIFISAFDEPEAKMSAFAAGGVDYVVKPINPDEVLARVATHLALRDLHLQLQLANGSMQRQLAELARANADLQRQIGLRQNAEAAAAQLLAQERQRARRLDALRDAMTGISGALDLASVREAVLERATGLLGADWGALAEPLPSGRHLRVAALRGLPQGLGGVAVPYDSGLLGEAAASRRIVNSTNPSEPLLRTGVALAAPLVAGDNLEAVIMVARPSAARPFDGEEEQLLDLFARQAATALQNARLFEEVRQLARTDPLTGLANRRHFFELAQRELERVRRVRGTMAVILLDIDHFKQVNDTFGHQSGDTALRAVADLLREGLRAADVSARFGGEELVVLLPDTDLVQATAVAERLRQVVSALSLSTERGTLSLTASFGVAAVADEQPGISLDALLARADEACYTAKSYGRDCVVAWPGLAAAMSDDQRQP